MDTQMILDNSKNIPVHNVLQTNGYIIDESWCEFLKANHFLVGLSVDGKPEIHNSLRHDRLSKEGTFQRVLNTAKLFDKYGVEYNMLSKPTAVCIRVTFLHWMITNWAILMRNVSRLLIKNAVKSDF